MDKEVYYKNDELGITVYKECSDITAGIALLAGFGNKFVVEIRKNKPSFLERLLGKSKIKVNLGYDYYSSNRPPYGNIRREIKEVKLNHSVLKITFEITENPGNLKYYEEEEINIQNIKV